MRMSYTFVQGSANSATGQRLVTHEAAALNLRHGASANQDLNINQIVPAFGPASSEDETMSWGFFVKHFQDPQESAKEPKLTWDTADRKVYVGLNPPRGSKQKGIFYPRAGTLGGSGSQNALIAILAHNSDWQYITYITGDRSWSPNSMQT